MKHPAARLSLSLLFALGTTLSLRAQEAVSSAPELVLNQDHCLDGTFIMPGWLAGIEGTMGVGGLETGVDAGFDDIVQNLDMIAAGTLELRHRRLGFIVDGMYLKASVGGNPPGPLLSNVSVGVEQILAEGVVTYRLLQGDRGWLDVLAGARYIYLGSELSMSVDSAGVRSLSESLSANIVDRTTTAAKTELNKRLSPLLGEIRKQLAGAAHDRVDEIKGQLEQGVSDRVEDVKQEIRDRIEEGIGFPHPGSGKRDRDTLAIGDGIAGSGPIRDALRDYIQAKVESEVEAARSKALAEAKQAVSAAVSSAIARARKEAQRRLDKAEAKLAKTIEQQINDRIPSSPVSGFRSWVDPFVGLRGRYQLTDKFYLAGRGDIGGFGVSSDMTWNLFGAVGMEVRDGVSMELGYRYLYVDYESGGFRMDVATKGPFVGMLIEF